MIYVSFRVFEKKNREYFCHFDVRRFYSEVQHLGVVMLS